MEKIRCVGLIPAEESVDPAAGLNVLVMAVNDGEEPETVDICLFGCIDREIRRLTAKKCTLAPGEHAHLYFHIAAECFSEAFWGEEPEEMTLFAGLTGPVTSGNLVFIQN